jgi:RND family efflux transporter MFP subunit
MRPSIPLALLLLATSAFGGVDGPATLVGVTEPGDQIDLSFPEHGIIRRLEVKEGEPVAQGQILVQLDCRVLEAQIEIARMKAASTAAVQAAEATLEMRSRRLRQLESLAASDRASSDELSRARAEHQIALADVQLAREATAQHSLEARQIEAQIEQRTLRAPFDGVVARIHRELAASVAPQEGPVLTLVRLDELDLVVHLDHRRLGDLEVGAEIPVTALDRPLAATATLAFVSPVVDAPSGTARLRLTLPNPGGAHRSGVKYRIELPGE